MQLQLLSCVDGVMAVSGSDCMEIGLQLFTVLITIFSQYRTEAIRDNVSHGFEPSTST